MVTILNGAGQVILEHPGDSLAKAFLADKYLRNAQLAGHDLSGADLRDANLTEANLDGCNLTGALLDDADLSKTTLRSANLCGASLVRTKLTRANLEGVSATECRFEEANLDDVIAHGADFSRSSFQNASLKRIQATRSKFCDCRFSGIYAGAAPEGIEWHEALQVGDGWNAAELTEGVFAQSDFSRAQLQGADLDVANLAGCCVQDVQMSGAKVFHLDLTGVDASSANGLQHCIGRLSWVGPTSEWPPRMFSSDSRGPIFDATTRLPRDLKFPKRRYNWIGPAKAGLFVAAIASLASYLFVSDWLNFLGRFVVFYVCSFPVLVGIHVGRVAATNIRLAENPYHFYNAESRYYRSLMDRSI